MGIRADSTTPQDAAIVVFPAGSWEVLHQSLELDACSSSADPELHRQIRAALDGIIQVDSLVHVAVAARDGRVELVHVGVRPRGAETALVGWLRRQPELPDDTTVEDWLALRDAGAAPEGIDAVVRTVPVNVTPRDDGA